MVTPNTDNDFVQAIALAREIQDDAEQRRDIAIEVSVAAAKNYFAEVEAQADLRELARLLSLWTTAELARVLAVHTMWTARHAYVQALQAMGGGA